MHDCALHILLWLVFGHMWLLFFTKMVENIIIIIIIIIIVINNNNNNNNLICIIIIFSAYIQGAPTFIFHINTNCTEQLAGDSAHHLWWFSAECSEGF